jgi:hypothetical protein
VCDAVEASMGLRWGILAVLFVFVMSQDKMGGIRIEDMAVKS